MVPGEAELNARSVGKSAARDTVLVALAVASVAFVTAAQAAPPPKKPPPPPPRAVVRSAPPRVVSRPPPTTRTVTRPTSTPRTTQIQQTAPKFTPKINPAATTQFHQITPKTNPTLQPNTLPQRTGVQNGIGQGANPQSLQRSLPQGVRGPTQVGLSPTGLKLGPRGPLVSPTHLQVGPAGLPAVKPKFPVVAVNNKFFPINKGQKFMYVGGVRRFFVPLGALGIALIGGSYWYPDGYVSLAGPMCTGFTPDGCGLHWRMVDFADGGGEPQCVQYCPQSGPPPAQFVSLPPPPPVPQGTCQMTIFSDPNFVGTSAPTVDNQPNLSESGWQNVISSIQVQAGTWDFFSDDDFGGATMRLTAGTYPMLTPDWDKKINSFMCVQPGPGA